LKHNLALDAIYGSGHIGAGVHFGGKEEANRLRRLLEFSAGTTSVVDPCVGTGAALHQLTNGAEAQKYGVELDANRAAAAATSGITTIQGDLFNTVAKVESFSLLYLNPPYDSEIGSMDNRRMEFLFLEHTTEGSDVGTVHKVCANPSCPVHHPKTQINRDDEKWKAEQEKQRKDQAIANATGLRVLAAVSGRWPR
jgi:predicted RNA methylase